MEITKAYRTRFLLESNFRSYYVDNFLKILSGKKVYRECQCYTKQTPLARVDNVFEFNGKKILLEVKLNILLEKDIIAQLKQYINAEYLYLTNDYTKRVTDFERTYMYIIDVFGFYKFLPNENKIIKLFDLDELKKVEDIVQKLL